jgi:hypothetical protein
LIGIVPRRRSGSIVVKRPGIGASLDAGALLFGEFGDPDDAFIGDFHADSFVPAILEGAVFDKD